jgi:predicted O-linked N-acetylglucosamine transferase (SPINDLY family)
MDYYLTDSIIHPETTQDKFTEELYRLPTYYQYPVQEGLPEVNELPAIKNGFITFCSFSKPEKINDEVVELWARVLNAIPDSRLMLKFFKHYSETLMLDRTIKRFADHGIDKDRLILNASHDTRTDHLTLYHQADIALDPFPFNGATTTFEALGMGIPVLTLQGDHFVSRVATSMVTHTGYPELAASSKDHYVEIAENLCEDLTALNETRQSLREQLHASSLCQGAEYSRNVEAAFRDMWKTWCETGGYKGK